MKPITAVLIGAGQRGAGAYAPYALHHPQELNFVAVAEPDPERRIAFQKEHGIADAMSFSSWDELLAKDKLADTAFICTMDTMHFEPTVQALEKGYHVLLEKPMSPEPAECITMGQLAEEYGRVFSICHVLRYTPFYTKIKEIIDSGHIGTPVSFQQIENVKFDHQAHSFVRGNWRNSKESSPMLLQKSCHDLDIILWLMGRDCINVSSFGSLYHFTEENAPKGAPKRCLDGCPVRDECPYYAPKIYLTPSDAWHIGVLRKVVSNDTSPEGLYQALKTGPYGRCVYYCDNDVVDHQVVNMEFEDGLTASFTMCAFTANGGRTLKIMGTKGQIVGDFDNNLLEIDTFLEGHQEIIHVNAEQADHGGGDSRLVKDFVQQVREGSPGQGRTSAAASVQSHLMVFAAEEARNNATVVNLEEYIKSIK